MDVVSAWNKAIEVVHPSQFGSIKNFIFGTGVNKLQNNEFKLISTMLPDGAPKLAIGVMALGFLRVIAMLLAALHKSTTIRPANLSYIEFVGRDVSNGVDATDRRRGVSVHGEAVRADHSDHR